jgi:hypothetical protein
MMTPADMERISRDALDIFKQNVEPSTMAQKYFLHAVIESLKNYERNVWLGSQGKLSLVAKDETH